MRRDWTVPPWVESMVEASLGVASVAPAQTTAAKVLSKTASSVEPGAASPDQLAAVLQLASPPPPSQQRMAARASVGNNR